MPLRPFRLIHDGVSSQRGWRRIFGRQVVMQPIISFSEHRTRERPVHSTGRNGRKASPRSPRRFLTARRRQSCSRSVTRVAARRSSMAAQTIRTQVFSSNLWGDSNDYFRPSFCINNIKQLPYDKGYDDTPTVKVKCKMFQDNPHWSQTCDPTRAGSSYRNDQRVHGRWQRARNFFIHCGCHLGAGLRSSRWPIVQS